MIRMLIKIKKCSHYLKIHIFSISLFINKMNLTCNTLCISIKSSVGFQRPKSLFKFFCFLDLFLLDDDDDATVEVDGILVKGFNALVLKGILFDGILRGWVVEVDGAVFAITDSGTLWTGDMTLSISVEMNTQK